MLNNLLSQLNTALFGSPAGRPLTDAAMPPADASLSGRLNALRHLHIPPIDPAPEGYVRVEDGNLKAIKNLTEYEKEREAILLPLAEEWCLMYLAMADLKARIHAAFDELEAKNTTRNSKRVQQGKSPSLTLYTLDRMVSIQRQNADRVRYEEDKILKAKNLIDQCVERWAEGSRDEMRKLVDLSFSKNAKGEFSRSAMVRLCRMESSDPQWREAMDIIRDAALVDGVASYLLVSVRDDLGKYHPLPLDIASVRSCRKPAPEEEQA